MADTQNALAGSHVPPDVPVVGSPRRPRRWLRWAVPILAFVVGISLGFASAGGDPRESQEFVALQRELTTAEDHAEALEGDVETAEADAAEAAREAENKIRSAQDDMTAKEAELDEREAEVAAREKAVAAAEKDPEPEPEPEPAVQSEPELSAGQVNALGQAQNYLDFSAFSRSGLIKQLEFEGYSTSDATAAVDSVGADWNEQAVKKAEEYLSFSSFSKSGLVDQLEFEGFTREQAEYGANKAY